MPHASFPRLLVNLRYSLRNFLFKQWHDTLNDEQLDAIYASIIEHFGLQGRLEELGGPVPNEKRSKNPPEMRIRGLLMRPKDQNNVGSENESD